MRNGTNTTKEQMAAAQDANKIHEWPDACGDCLDADWIVYKDAQAQRAHRDWTPIDLISLGNLAKLQVDLTEQHDTLRDEGHIVHGGKTGLTKVQNPRCRVVMDLTSAINTVARRLGITAMSTPSDKRSQAGRGEKEREAEHQMTGDTSGERTRDGQQLM